MAELFVIRVQRSPPRDIVATMWKRILLFGLIGLFLGTAVALFLFRKELSFLDFGDPVFTEQIPESRPKRLDRRKLARFSDLPIEQILETLANEEKSAAKPDGEEVGPTTAERLLASLPDAPLPFPGEAEPADEKWLRDFVTSMKKEDGSEPTAEELWQFNLALAALNISPDQLPESLRQNTNPENESDTLSVHFAMRDGDLVGPFAIGDFDGEPGPEIIDQGGGRMSKLAGTGAPIPLDSHTLRYPGNGLYPADFDSDGDLDLYLTRGDGFPDSLLRNDGSGRFEDITIETGLLAFRDTQTAAWIDYDADGLPDLLVGSDDQPLELYHQTEGGGFQPVAWDLKLWVPRGVDEIVVSDISSDGFPDFFLGIEGLPDRFCANRPAKEWSEWKFEDIIAEAGLSYARNGSVTIFDFNNDGAPDLLVNNAEGKLALYVNQGDLNFLDVTSDVGLPNFSDISAIAPVDMDNDGFQDLVLGTGPLQINRVLWNRGGLSLREISVTSGISFLDEPVEIVGSDLDQNGASDLVYRNRSGKVRLFEASGDLQSWTRLRLSELVPGTRVSLIVRDRDWILHPIERIVGTKSDFTVGLGDADVIESIKVFYPGDTEPAKELQKMPPNQLLEIELPKRPKKRATVPIG